eukprot:scaffold9666_cov132-Skeletonema_menzelii.AAC.2
MKIWKHGREEHWNVLLDGICDEQDGGHGVQAWIGSIWLKNEDFMPYIRSGANLRRQLGRLVCSVSSRASYMILLLHGLYYERSSRLMHLSRPAARMYSCSSKSVMVVVSNVPRLGHAVLCHACAEYHLSTAAPLSSYLTI